MEIKDLKLGQRVLVISEHIGRSRQFISKIVKLNKDTFKIEHFDSCFYPNGTIKGKPVFSSSSTVIEFKTEEELNSLSLQWRKNKEVKRLKKEIHDTIDNQEFSVDELALILNSIKE